MEVLSFIAALLPATKFGGLTLSQWVSLVTAFAQLEPILKADLAALHPVFAQIGTELAQGATHEDVAWNRITHLPSEMSDPR